MHKTDSKSVVGEYYQLAKPGIVYGNLLNTTAGFLLASRLHIPLLRLLMTLAGTALVIACACVINNYIDRGIDVKMERTKRRSLVTGSINGAQAFIYAITLGVIGFALLVRFTNWLTVAIGVLAVIFYVVLYGITKRRTEYGTLVGSIAGAAPIVAGYTAFSNRLDGGALGVFLILTFWQMPHFYAIAVYRVSDYRAAGLPVLSVKKGAQVTKVHMLVYIVGFMLACVLLSALGYTGYSFLIVMTVISCVWLYRGIRGFRAPDTTKWARQMFGFSLIVILMLAIMLSVGARLP
jgi:protoheme IX farnesyltransferase